MALLRLAQLDGAAAAASPAAREDAACALLRLAQLDGAAAAASPAARGMPPAPSSASPSSTAPRPPPSAAPGGPAARGPARDGPSSASPSLTALLPPPSAAPGGPAARGPARDERLAALRPRRRPPTPPCPHCRQQGAAPSRRRRARPSLSREVVATTFVASADLRLLPSTRLALSGPDACLNIADSAWRMLPVAAAGSFGFGSAREVKPPSPSPWSRGVLIWDFAPPAT
nr:uncharacterized protein LOC127310171 [Lolium perenne]